MTLIAQRMLDAAFAAEATGVANLQQVGLEETLHTFAWAAVSVGVVVIEAGPDVDYAGEWDVLETVTFAGTSPKVDTVRIVGAYPILRHRLTEPLNDGGTVTSRIDGAA